ncbi:FHA domain-containing protein [Cohnella abietis]|uniref:FHA domain-containing protein n=1 Tax=Cohnella abietis TaxID=2507935 RepID=A0A3T1D060_9BACL|nr:FHA domain-containing protein [Cohnella abietis]BBI31482.1 hypothetical protein KCTCHS21_08810 [Cohnella abietis]
MKDSEQVNKDRGDRFKFERSKLPRNAKAIWGITATVVSLLGIIVVPISVSAAGSLETSASQVKVGTLPLLAALGVGIAVAVAAVIAFLQMAARGKELNDLSTHTNEGIEGIEVRDAEDHGSVNDSVDPVWEDEDATDDSEYEHNPLTDYTIPTTQLLAYPDQAELADDGEPRVYGVEGEHAGNGYRVLNRRLTFGRDPRQCVILFPYEAGEISRLHCTLRYMEESRLFTLEDHGSSNGTFLSNGERIQPGKRVELRAGDRFSLSGNDHVFEVLDAVNS